MRTRLARQVLIALPTAARATVGMARAATLTLGALVLVTTLVPVFVVCLAALGTHPAGRGRLTRSSGSG